MNQIEKLELELNTARRNLTAAQDEHKAVVQLWEVGVVNPVYRSGRTQGCGTVWGVGVVNPVHRSRRYASS